MHFVHSGQSPTLPYGLFYLATRFVFVCVSADGRPSQLLLNAQKELIRRRELSGVTYRPPTPSQAEKSPAAWIARLEARYDPVPAEDPSEADDAPSLLEQEVRLSPTIAAACLNRENRHNDAGLDAPYRLYKILQTMDTDGRGWLAQQAVGITLTCKNAPTFIYGKRQLKIILRRGEGLFWKRVKVHGEVRIRLVSRARLALGLNCPRLRGREVALPLRLLLGSGRGRQADVNAALYAAVHAGQIRGKREARPITRAKVSHISGCSKYRQRSYEKRIKMSVGRHIHILTRFSSYGLDRARIHHHLPAYKHIDYLGKINRHQRGAAYIAVRLGNSYQPPQQFTVVHSRRQRTINRHLAGLCSMGSEGSGREPYVRLYHENAAAAVHSYNRDPHTSAYWPLTEKGSHRLWRKIE
ncbi:MAG: hypothetical protein R3293_23145 [Candidatus Promineifilaceae bacterium]|nr:hypothetical protein [Candidatus Promineifilaceae bacterium]